MEIQRLLFCHNISVRAEEEGNKSEQSFQVVKPHQSYDGSARVRCPDAAGSEGQTSNESLRSLPEAAAQVNP